MTRRPIEALPPELEALVAAERDAPAPSRQTRARVAARVAVSAAAGAPLIAAAGSATAAASSTSVLAKVLIVAVTAGAVGGGTVIATRDGGDGGRAPVEPSVSAPVRAGAVAPAPSAAVPIGEPPAIIGAEPASGPTPPPARSERRSAPAVPAAEPPPAPPPPLALERALLLEARHALKRGDAERVLAVVRRHASEFPAGTLAEEREILWVLALEQAGQDDAARVRARAFLRAYPDSFYQRRVDHLVDSETDSSGSGQ